MTYRKCRMCNELITDGTDYEWKPRQYVHKRCFNASVKAIAENKKEQSKEKKPRQSKAKAELKESVSETDYADKKMMYGYLRDCLLVEPNVKIYTLVDKYVNQMGCTYKGIYQTLVYLNEIEKKELTGDVVGIVPYYYKTASDYYENLQKIEQSNADLSAKYSTKVVKIQKPSGKRRQEINMDEL